MARVFRWERPVPQSWQRELRRLTVPTEHQSHLVMRWVPLANRRHAQRWVVFEAVPFPYCLPVVSGLDPSLIRTDPLVGWAWDYAERHNAFPVPFWVAQGTHLGHPFSYNVIEKAQAGVGLLPAAPPQIGELQYVEPNAQMFQAIRRRKIINRRLQDAMAERELVREQAERQARQTMLNQLDVQLHDAVDAASREFVDTAPTMERGQANRANIDDEHLAEYVETGHLPYLKAPI